VPGDDVAGFRAAQSIVGQGALDEVVELAESGQLPALAVGVAQRAEDVEGPGMVRGGQVRCQCDDGGLAEAAAAVGRGPEQLAVAYECDHFVLGVGVETEALGQRLGGNHRVTVGSEALGQQQPEEQPVGVLDVIGLDRHGLAGVEHPEALKRCEPVALQRIERERADATLSKALG
jgi:hypothetical protein